jgi:hypothetical protein
MPASVETTATALSPTASSRRLQESWQQGIEMAPSLPHSDPAFQQQAANLIDDRRATHYPSLSHSMQGLKIQLIIGLDRHEPHVVALEIEKRLEKIEARQSATA